MSTMSGQQMPSTGVLKSFLTPMKMSKDVIAGKVSLRFCSFFFFLPTISLSLSLSLFWREEVPNFLFYFISLSLVTGTCGGIVVTLIGHPFDTLKVRLQAQSIANPVYNGLVDCFKKVCSCETAPAAVLFTLFPPSSTCSSSSLSLLSLFSLFY